MAKKEAAHRQDLESRALKGELMKSMMGTILGYTTFGGSMCGAVYLLLHDKPIQSPGRAHRCTRLCLWSQELLRLRSTKSRHQRPTIAARIERLKALSSNFADPVKILLTV
jgi:hypothetical protein